MGCALAVRPDTRGESRSLGLGIENTWDPAVAVR